MRIQLTAELIAAYRSTDYHVLANPPFTLHVDQESIELVTQMARHGVSSAVFITAANPTSKQLDEDENSRLNAELAAIVVASGYTHLPGVGIHPSGNWPPENSLLVLGAPLSWGVATARQFDQNAILFANADGIPALIPCT